ncbi:MAG: phosphoglycerate dehydrogenase [Chloroflexi bacterium]|nr:phosphoglycerate dehydrogenase [Chloroflexota bacterium]
MTVEAEAQQRRVLIADRIAEEGLTLLRQIASVDVRTGMKEPELAGIISDYDALVVRSETKVTAAVISAAKRLQVIGRAGVGIDNVDVPAATKHGVIVVNAPTGNTVAAAEHTWALLLGIARHVAPANASLRAGRWERSRFIGTELRGKTLGVVGLGRVAGEVVQRALAFEMHILAYDPFIAPEAAERIGARLTTLEEVLRESDVVSLHVVLNDATRNMIGSEQLALMKHTAYVVNCSRGGVIDEEALHEALQQGRIAGAALDVFAQEPAVDSPLVREERVLATPHLGASTAEAQVSVAVDVAEQIAAVFRGETPRYAVNVPISSATAAALRPYLPVAELTGKLVTLLSDGQLQSLEITYAGDLAEQETDALRLATLAGLLGPTSATRVTLVNAGEIARQRGLRVVERREPTLPEPYVALLTARAITNAGGAEVSGTLVGQEPRIVGIDGYAVDIRPSDSYWIIGRHTDRPGMIGRIGMLLGSSDINISFMQVGRREARGEALLVLGVDEPIPQSIFHELLNLPHLHRAKVVRL